MLKLLERAATGFIIVTSSAFYILLALVVVFLVVVALADLAGVVDLGTPVR